MFKFLVPISFAVAIAGLGCSNGLSPSSEESNRIILPRIGTLGRFPKRQECVVVNVDRQGNIEVDNEALKWDKLIEHIRNKANLAGHDDIPLSLYPVSKLNIILRLDCRLPLSIPAKIIRRLGLKDIAVVRFYYAATHLVNGEEGYFALFPPIDCGIAPSRETLLIIEMGKSKKTLLTFEGLRYILTRPSVDSKGWLFCISANYQTPLDDIFGAIDVLFCSGAKKIILGCDDDFSESSFFNFEINILASRVVSIDERRFTFILIKDQEFFDFQLPKIPLNLSFPSCPLIVDGIVGITSNPIGFPGMPEKPEPEKD